MKKYLIFLALYVVGNSYLYSQVASEEKSKNWKSQINVEAGMIYPNGNIRENVSIRQNISSFYVDQVSNGTVYSDTYGTIVGASWEYLNQNLKFGISGGLRYVSFQTEIYGNSSSRSDFFYLRYSIQDSNTKFARVKGLNEIASFMSIPVELKYNLYEYQQFKFFVSGGFEFSLLNIVKTTGIDFQEKDMEIYKNDILDIISISTNNFYSSLYGTAGLSYGKENKTSYQIEFFLPSIFISQDNFSLTEVKNYTGFKFSIEFPLNKNL